MIARFNPPLLLLQRLKVGPATFYGMSSGSRSNVILAERYPEQVAALVISPLTGGSIAAQRLSEEYYLGYLSNENQTSMEEVAKTPLWASFYAKTTLGMTNGQLAALEVPATLILHHGAERDFLHPIVNSRAATTLLRNSKFEIAPTLEPILEVLLPFVKQHTPVMDVER